jgi:hypothetical protein
MAYLRSFYMMRAILTNEKPYPAKYIDYLKWFVVISAGLLCASLATVNTFWYVHEFSGDYGFNYSSNT